MAKRIQRKRTLGWRMPPNTTYVGRPTWFGNPFTPDNYWDAGYGGGNEIAIKECVRAYREWLLGERFTLVWRSPSHFIEWLEKCRADRVKSVGSLRGKDLACWCPLVDQHGNAVPCHADVLLSIANDLPMEEVIRENLRRAKGEAVR